MALARSRSPMPSSAAADQGLTLVECIMGILVVGFAGAAIAPAMVLSVATRVQSQRAEQALELAQSEVNRARLLIERRDDLDMGGATDANLPPESSVSALGAVPAPSGIAGGADCIPTTPTEGKPIALDPEIDACSPGPDEEPDFVVQTFRRDSRLNDDGFPVAFEMGVRVYDIRAFRDGTSGLQTEGGSLGLVSSEGSRLNSPLAVLYTEILASEDGSSLCELIQYEGVSSLPLGCE